MRGVPVNREIRQQKAPAGANGSSLWEKEIRLGPAWPMRERQRFYQMLAILIEAGLTLSDGLEMLSGQASHRETRRLCLSLRTSLERGNSLQEAALAESARFSPFEVQSLKMGEETGKMCSVFARLAALYEHRQRVRRRLTQALTYPASVVLVAGAVLAFMMLKVVPMFAGIFSQFDAALPPLTQAMIDVSAILQRNWAVILGILLLLVPGISWGKNHAGVRRVGDKWMLSFPFLGALVLKLHLSRLCFSLSQMLQSGVTLDQALALQQGMVQLIPLREAMERVRGEIVTGHTLHEAVKQEQVFPRLFVQIVRVGEKSARLGEMLEKLALSLEEEASAGIGQLMQMLEPLLIIVLGALVALVLAAMYLPMFELSAVF